MFPIMKLVPISHSITMKIRMALNNISYNNYLVIQKISVSGAFINTTAFAIITKSYSHDNPLGSIPLFIV